MTSADYVKNMNEQGFFQEKMGRRIVFLWVLVIVVITTWPWSDFRGHSHWSQVTWIPLYDVNFSPLSILNVFGNILLFVPFGFFLTKLLAGTPQALVMWSLVWGSLISISIELFQVYCHGHFATMTDVSSNVIGAGVGAAFGTVTYHRNGSTVFGDTQT